MSKRPNPFVSRTRRSWKKMNDRCNNPKDNRYEIYGGAGIVVCDRWRGRKGFANFLADMGERPDGMTLDRIDSNGNYEPGNCRWATVAEQNRNRNCVVLNERTAAEIRALVASGWSRRYVAEMYGVKLCNVYAIASGTRWAPAPTAALEAA